MTLAEKKMATTSLNLTTALDDAAAELVLLDPEDAAAWEAARNKILSFIDGAPDAVRDILKAVAEKMANSGTLSAEQKKPLLDELNKLIQDGLEQVWDKANAEIKTAPPASTDEVAPPPPVTAPVAQASNPSPERKPPEPEKSPTPAVAAGPREEKPTVSTPSEPPVSAQSLVTQTPPRRALGGKFLTFFLDKEEFGFEILRVQEIISQLPITPVPRTPDHVQGVINLRGKIIPVVDLRRKLGLPPLETHGCIIIVRAHNIEVGVSVDQVSEVSTISDDQIDPAPSFGSGVIGEYLLGIGKIGDRVKLLLDVDRTLAPEHLAGARAGDQTVVALNGGSR
jgi:purine-binding chemotaxis protein CheW